MNNIEKYTDKDWEKLASQFSGETVEPSNELAGFRDDDDYNTEKNWIEMGRTGNEKKVDVDKAWNNIYSKIEEDGLATKTVKLESSFRRRTFIRAAAAVLVIAGLGLTMLYLNNSGYHAGNIVIAANANERNIEVPLPDGSKVYLNRNARLSYNRNFGKSTRNVVLKGEAFFDIKRDPSKPFIIDAGKASVKVLGTSFSVLTNNSVNAVEVFVKTGTVMVSDNSGAQSLVLEPGFIGTMDSKSSSKVLNENPNYLSWNTDLLVFEKKPLSVVFSDLKKVFDIDIVSDDPDILNLPLTTTFEKEPQDTIIRVICSTFSGSYTKEGSVYHLSKK
jgi:ferric-dicitrate binding protein FerR (iron transport regulator)